MTNKESVAKYAPLCVRVGVGVSFLLLGLLQMTEPAGWVSWMPQSMQAMMSRMMIAPSGFMFSTGVFNTLVGFFALVGVFTRIAASLMALHLLGVLATIGFNDVWVRDLGLLLAALAVALHGSDEWCLEQARKKHE